MVSLFTIHYLPGRVSDDDESSPVKGMFVPRIRDQLHSRAPHCFALSRPASQIPVKLEHQLSRACRLDLPLAHYRGRAARDEERPAHSNYTFAGADPPARRLARGKHHKVCFKVKVHHLPCLEQPVIERVVLW